jgi:hypothetical protein
MLLGAPGEPAGLGPSGVPEEDHAAFDQHVGHPDQVPFPAVAGIEGLLDLLSFTRGLVQHEFLGEVSSVALLCHEDLPFRGLVEIRSISSLADAGQLFSCPVFLFTELPRRVLLVNPRRVLLGNPYSYARITYSRRGRTLRISYVCAHKPDNTLQTRIAPVGYPAHEGSEGGHEG